MNCYWRADNTEMYFIDINHRAKWIFTKGRKQRCQTNGRLKCFISLVTHPQCGGGDVGL